jgi:hypothetical protein
MFFIVTPSACFVTISLRHLPGASQAIGTCAIVTTASCGSVLAAFDAECEVSTTRVSGWVRHSGSGPVTDLTYRLEGLIHPLTRAVLASSRRQVRLALRNSALIAERCYNSQS